METELLTHDSAEASMPSQQEHLTPDETNLRRCPFCAEWIQPLAIKCRHCSEFLDGSSRGPAKSRPKKWYYATGTVVMALLCLGPLALPLVWLNPRYKSVTKVVITVAVLALMIACSYLLGALYRQFLGQISALGL